VKEGVPGGEATRSDTTPGAAESEARVSIRELRISLKKAGHLVPVLRGINLAVQPGEVHCVAGESGSGKTVTCRGALRLLSSPPFFYNGGSVRLGGRELLTLSEEKLRAVWGRQVGMVFQEPGQALNPSLTVEVQLQEHLKKHFQLQDPELRQRTIELLEDVELPEPKRLLGRYPHELSGGMQQRLGIAIATACNPELLVADEPTSSLDVIIQDQILALLLRFREERGLSVLFVTHDLGVVQRIADRVSILYAGKIVETASKERLTAGALHPYTVLLLSAVPRPEHRHHRLVTIPGTPPLPEEIPRGCPFHPRCPMAQEICRREPPPLEEKAPEAGGTPGHRVACHFPGSLKTESPGAPGPATGDSRGPGAGQPATGGSA
jgi:oligopeptide/dipeptide ABC transporter ATP-binding protein